MPWPKYLSFFCLPQVLMFSDKDSWILFTLLAAILHLGNLRFEGNMQLCTVFSYCLTSLEQTLYYCSLYFSGLQAESQFVAQNRRR